MLRVFRIQLRHRNIWMSEPVGILVAIVVTGALFAMGLFTLSGSYRIIENNRHLAMLKTQKALLTRELAELSIKKDIAEVLRESSRGKLREDVLWRLTGLVYENSHTFGYDPYLLLAVIHVESVFDPRAGGRYQSGAASGAFGLMQLKFSTAKAVADKLGIPFNQQSDLFVPEINVAVGTAYLTELIAQFHSLKLGILAYNLGPEALKTVIRNREPLPLRYYAKVIRSYYQLKKLKDNP